MSKLEPCPRCDGSGEIGVHVTLFFECAGPVPEDNKTFHQVTCSGCFGTGCIEMPRVEGKGEKP